MYSKTTYSKHFFLNENIRMYFFGIALKKNSDIDFVSFCEHGGCCVCQQKVENLLVKMKEKSSLRYSFASRKDIPWLGRFFSMDCKSSVQLGDTITITVISNSSSLFWVLNYHITSKRTIGDDSAMFFITIN